MREEALLSGILDTTHALIVVLDQRGRIVLFNGACERVTGYRFEEVKGRCVWDFLLPPEEAAGVKAVFRDLRRVSFPNAYASNLVTKSGTRRWIEWSNSAISNKRGDVVRIIGTGIDVSDRKIAEEELRRSEARFQALCDNALDVTSILDRDLAIRFVTPSVERVLGYAPREVIGRSCLDLVHPADRAATEEGFRTATAGPGTVVGIERRMHHKNGSWVHLESFVINLLANQHVMGIVVTSRDVTGRKLSEAQRIARDVKQRDALVREIHHRIKNHLQGVIALLRQQADGGVMEQVVERLAAVAAMHGLQAAARRGEVLLEQIVQTQVSSMKALYDHFPIQLSVQGGVGARVLDGEVVPLALTLNELLMNAWKHSRPARGGNPVQIALYETNDCARVVIRNSTGRLASDFDYDAEEGLGTGLSLVRSLLPPHGMRVRFANAKAPDGVSVELVLTPPVLVERQ